jgi:hypothetical protein
VNYEKRKNGKNKNLEAKRNEQVQEMFYMLVVVMVIFVTFIGLSIYYRGEP